jgi:hypothetical protein
MLLRKIIAIATIAVGCLGGNVFAQSTAAQPAAPEAAAADTQPTDNSAQATINWSSISSFDSGTQSSVALHPNGLIVEVHSSGPIGYSGLWYHIGKLEPGATRPVTWGPSHKFVPESMPGAWPSVAITQEGYVVIIWSNSFHKSGSVLRYSVGTLDPALGTNQVINFKLMNVQFDNGFHNSLAVNYNGTIVEAHEGNGGKGMYYRIGYLTLPSKNDFSITWTSGQAGVLYDNGINPHIAINNNNDVVEVHQVGSDDQRLHYLRAKLLPGSISFLPPPAPRYDNYAYIPTVALLNDLYVVETNYSQPSRYLYRPQYRVGLFDKSDPNKINWGNATNIADSNREPGGLATNGSYLLATFISADTLYYSWATAP